MTSLPVINFPMVPLGNAGDYAAAAQLIANFTGTTAQGFAAATADVERETQLKGTRSKLWQSELRARGAKLEEQFREQRLELEKLRLGSDRMARFYEDIYELQYFDLSAQLVQASPEEKARLTTEYPFLNFKLRETFGRMADRSLGIDIRNDIYARADEDRRKAIEAGRTPPEFNYIKALDGWLQRLRNAGLSPESQLNIQSTLLPQLRNRMSGEAERTLSRMQSIRTHNAEFDTAANIGEWLNSPEDGEWAQSRADIEGLAAITGQGKIGAEAAEDALVRGILKQLPKVVTAEGDPRRVLDRLAEMKDDFPQAYSRVIRDAEALVDATLLARKEAAVEEAATVVDGILRTAQYPEELADADAMVGSMFREVTPEEKAKAGLPPETEVLPEPIALPKRVRNLAAAVEAKHAQLVEQTSAEVNAYRVLAGYASPDEVPVTPSALDPLWDKLEAGIPVGARQGGPGVVRRNKPWSAAKLYAATARAGLSLTDRQRERLSDMIRLGPQQNIPAALAIFREVELAVGPKGARKFTANVPKSEYFIAAARTLRNFPLGHDRVNEVSAALSTKRGEIAFDDAEEMLWGTTKAGEVTSLPTIDQKLFMRQVFLGALPAELDEINHPYSDFQQDVQAHMQIGLAVAANHPQNANATIGDLQQEMLQDAASRLRGKYWLLTTPDGSKQVVPDIFAGAPARREEVSGMRLPGTDVVLGQTTKQRPHDLEVAVHDYYARREQLLSPELASALRTTKKFGLRMQWPIERIEGAPRPGMMPMIGGPWQTGSLPIHPTETEQQRKERLRNRRLIQYMPDYVEGEVVAFFGWDPHAPGDQKYRVIVPQSGDEVARIAAKLNKGGVKSLTDEERGVYGSHLLWQGLMEDNRKLLGADAFRSEPELDYRGGWTSAEQFVRYGVGGEEWFMKMNNKGITLTQRRLGRQMNRNDPQDMAVFDEVMEALVMETHGWPRMEFTDRELSLYGLRPQPEQPPPPQMPLKAPAVTGAVP